ncbi:MAG: hypothetical protein ACLU80_08880 [Dorea sp.]
MDSRRIFIDADEALRLMDENAVEKAGYQPGKDSCDRTGCSVRSELYDKNFKKYVFDR